ncbi:hypothetical protein BH20BAC1_BH20BAC1_26310 [soil metagenome]
MSNRNDFVNSMKEMTETDLKLRIEEDQLRMKKLRFAHAVSPIENPMNIRGIRRDLARLNTELKKKQTSPKEKEQSAIEPKEEPAIELKEQSAPHS